MSISLSNDIQFQYTEFQNVNSPCGQLQSVKLSEFFERLSSFTRTPETAQQYAGMSKDERGKFKNGAGFVAAEFESGRRKNNLIKCRYAAVLDVEWQKKEQPAGNVSSIIDRIQAVKRCFALYSTHSHTADDPRFRAVFPFAEPLTAEQSEFISRYLARVIGTEWVDPASYKPAQLMFFPSCSIDATPVFEYSDGALISLDEAKTAAALIYGMDVDDMRSWGEDKKQDREKADRAADPTTKSGIVGAFCRVYDIYNAIDTFLPGTYEPFAGSDTRYSYVKGSSSGGAVIYDNGLFLYSHHATDPAGGLLVNAFDLVRLHKYPELDDTASNQKMLEFCQTLPEVIQQIHEDRRADAAADFEGLQAVNAESGTCGDLASLDAFEELEAEWLVPGYIPRGEITLLAGNGGVGKSFAWADIAAAVSTGRKCFLEGGADDTRREPKNVIFFSAEDSVTHILKKRLREAGANARLIKTIDCTSDNFGKVKLNSAYLELQISQYRPALCIFDPLQAFLIVGTDATKRSDMRAALAPLHALGEKFGTTFLIIMHTNKRQNAWGRDRLADSADLWDIARSVLISGNVPGNEGLRYAAHEKSNYGALQQTTLFRIEGGRVQFASYTEKRDRDFVLENAAGKSSEKPKTDLAANFMLDILKERGGEMQIGELETAAKDNLFTGYAIRAAKQQLHTDGKIKTRFEPLGGKGGQWFISLTGGNDKPP